MIYPFIAKEGLKDQIGRSITLSEVKEGALRVGEEIFRHLNLEDMSLSKLTLVQVSVGDLEIGEAIGLPKAKIEWHNEVQKIKVYAMIPIGELARVLEIETKWDDSLQTATFISYQ